MAMSAIEIKKFVADLVTRCDERLTGNRANMLANLDKRIQEATDLGLGSVVYWHKWMNYSEACSVRLELVEYMTKHPLDK